MVPRRFHLRYNHASLVGRCGRSASACWRKLETDTSSVDRDGRSPTANRACGSLASSTRALEYASKFLIFPRVKRALFSRPLAKP